MILMNLVVEEIEFAFDLGIENDTEPHDSVIVHIFK